MVSTSIYFNIVLITRLDAGVYSPSWRVKKALEARGHTVFTFTPERWPGLFDASGSLNLAGLRRFLEVQQPDCLMVCDGMGVTMPQDAPVEVPCGVLCASRREACASVANSTPGSLGFALVVGTDAPKAEDIAGFDGVVLSCPPLADAAHAREPLANDVACGPGVLCVQDATPERAAFMQALAARPEFAGMDVRCFGASWPEPLRRSPAHTGLAYAARSSFACVAFEEAAGAQDALATDALLALVRADGAELVCVGGSSSPWCAEHATIFPDADEALEALANRAESLRAAGTPFFSRRLPQEDAGATHLDDALADALASLRALYAPRGLMAGSPVARTVVCVLGYFGMGNFGDEYILATLVARTRRLAPGAAVVAVGENPEHTLRTRGVYSLTLSDKHALDEVLAGASVALVAAGLLFDQGIRWTMGQAELVSYLPHTDVPGIASYVELAFLNEAAPVFYGCGAGPLDVADGRKLVRLMGRLGARFMTRDEQTAALVRSCRVPEAQVRVTADVAFLGAAQRMPDVDAWLAKEGLDLTQTRLVALSLRAYENAPAELPGRVAHALDAVARQNADVAFAGCVLDPSDRAVIEAVRSAMAMPERLHVFDAGEAVEPVADLLARCAAGVSMRYHCSLVLGAGGHPCVGLGYLPKVAALYEDLGEADALLAMDASAEQIGRALEDVLAWDAARLADLACRVGGLRRRAEEAEAEMCGLMRAGATAKAGLVARELFLRTIPASELEKDRLRAEATDERTRSEALGRGLEEACRRRDEALAEVNAVRACHSYRLGHALLELPRRVAACLRLLPGRRQEDGRR